MAEKKSRRIVNMVHASTKYMLNSSYVEDVANTVYLLTKCLTKNVKLKSPSETWISLGKVFGCTIDAHART